MTSEATPELIARARRDRAAFGQLYDLYLPRVFGFCRCYTWTREEAEDLTAETFVRALAGMERYEDRGVPFSRWLLRIARNVVLNHARTRGRETATDLPPLLDEAESCIDLWHEVSWLRAHVDALSPVQRDVLRLRFYEDQRFADIAERMGRSEGAVKQLLRRALRVLHRQIQDEAEEGAANE